MTIGERIGKVIEHEGIKKVVFADKLKIDQSYVTQLINGRRAPSDRLLDDISEKFSVSRNWLDTGEGEMYIKSASQTLDAITARYNGSPTFRAMLDVYARLSAEDQNAVERYIAQLTEALATGQPAEKIIPGNASGAEISNTLMPGTISDTETHHQDAEAAR